MKTPENGDLNSEPASAEGTSALAEERQEIDDNLLRERQLVDSTFYEIQHDATSQPSVQQALRELRRRLRQQRHVIDSVRTDSRQATDDAIARAQRSTTDDLNRAEGARDEAEAILHLDRAEAHRSLWSVLAELDVIASSVQAIRLRSVELPQEISVFDLVNAIEVASGRVLELVGDMLDPEDNRNRHHEVGGSG